jgi:hypothetical protein
MHRQLARYARIALIALALIVPTIHAAAEDAARPSDRRQRGMDASITSAKTCIAPICIRGLKR